MTIRLSNSKVHEIYQKIDFWSDEWTPEASDVIECWAIDQAGSILTQLSDEIGLVCDHMPWTRFGGTCVCGHIRATAQELTEDRVERYATDEVDRKDVGR